MQVFASPGTFTTPATTTKIKVTVVGGGGGGVPGPTTGSGGGGGAIYVGPVSASTPYPVTVGAGGALNTSGGTSSFASLASATGGVAPTNIGGIGTTGTLQFAGDSGSANGGGGSFFGGGGNIPGANGRNYGGGASNSGTGGGGVVVVEF
jgi:hypothetical protein